MVMQYLTGPIMCGVVSLLSCISLLILAFIPMVTNLLITKYQVQKQIHNPTIQEMTDETGEQVLFAMGQTGFWILSGYSMMILFCIFASASKMKPFNFKI